MEVQKSMNLIAMTLKTKIFNQCGSLKSLTWTQHLQNNHVAFPRDCKTCQESLQPDKPHPGFKHPLCGALSLDTSGPFKLAPDIVGKSKYLLIGTLTWMLPITSPVHDLQQEGPLPEEAADLDEEVPALQQDDDASRKRGMVENRWVQIHI